MSIFPLPQFEADLAEADREAYEKLKPPTAIVVRYGAMKMVGEFPYEGEAKPGCGSKLVVRTHRGVELGEMLTSTCPNAGCSKSVTRKEMLEYIDNSGGRDYPFSTDGEVLRIATIEDMNKQGELEKTKPDLVKTARGLVAEHNLQMKIVDAEPILGGEVLTFYFTSEERVDFRELVREMAREFHARIELRQVGARDEARLVADYERCGQHCCCQQFLKVLKPVSMRSAKIQKATLDPLKISGRCGRLMCCLRYEDETYDSLRKNLPRRGARVGTPEGAGFVIDTQILTQLVLVELEPPTGGAPGTEYERKQVAIPVEELMDPDAAPQRAAMPKPDPFRGKRPEKIARRERDDRTKDQQQDAYREKSQREAQPKAKGDDLDDIMAGLDTDATPTEQPREGAPKKKRRRRKGKGKGQGSPQAGDGAAPAPPKPAGGDKPRENRPPRQGPSGQQDSGDGSGGSSGSRSSRGRRGRGRGRGGRGGRGGAS
jgi:cell fate regulator YaaT (PSP1 superfamily)